MRSNRYSHWLALLIPFMVLTGSPALAQKYVCLQSTQGEWCVELLRSVAPATVTNFLRYVNEGGYANSLVHRSVPGFVIQSGGFYLDAGNVINPLVTYGTIKNEFNRSNVRGTVAMAKVGSDPNSATSQWFVNLDSNVFLDLAANNSFTVFANVVYGMEVVDRIAALSVYDASAQLGANFAELPLVANQLSRQNLVLINQAYTSDLLPGSTVQPYHCSVPVANEALTELCSNSVTFPVNLAGGASYEVTLDLVASQPALVFAIRAGSLKPLANLPNSYASYNPLTNLVVIPSVRVGSTIYDNVQLLMPNSVTQRLTLQSFVKR
ncbi:MAG: peptidylprolyl isomerase [Gammaproteobacteria bacterium]